MYVETYHARLPVHVDEPMLLFFCFFTPLFLALEWRIPHVLFFVFVSSVSGRGRRGGLGGQTARLVRYDNVSAKQTLYLFPPHMLFFCQSVIFLLFPHSVVSPHVSLPAQSTTGTRPSPDIHSPRYIFTLYGYIIFVYRTPSHIRRRSKS